MLPPFPSLELPISPLQYILALLNVGFPLETRYAFARAIGTTVLAVWLGYLPMVAGAAPGLYTWRKVSLDMAATGVLGILVPVAANRWAFLSKHRSLVARLLHARNSERRPLPSRHAQQRARLVDPYLRALSAVTRDGLP